MPAERFYLPDPALAQKQTVILDQDEFHHLAHVMRGKKGDLIEIVNGHGILATAEVLSLEKKQAILSIISTYEEARPNLQMILAQALPRLPRLDFLLEKSVELGVTEIWLFPGMLSEKKDLSPTQQERVEHIVTSAMKQCGRLYRPTVSILPPIASWSKNNLQIPHHAFFGDTKDDAPSFLEELLQSSSSSLFIAIGPEKGFQKQEIAAMEKLSIKGVHLHPYILRTETAAIHSISLASSFLFRTNKP